MQTPLNYEVEESRAFVKTCWKHPEIVGVKLKPPSLVIRVENFGKAILFPGESGKNNRVGTSINNVGR